MHDPTLESQLRQIMAHCGRPHYILTPVSDGELVVAAEPTVRQTPLTAADLECIRGEVAKLPGWRLVEVRSGK